MLRKGIFLVGAAAVAAALAGGGCSAAVKEARFRSIELTPATQAGAETVADLQITGKVKVMGTANGVLTAGNPDLRTSLYAEALEAALASDSSRPDVLVAPSYYEVVESKDNLTVVVVGYPARYTNFRRNDAAENSGAPYSIKQLPGGISVIGYDKNSYTVKPAGDNLLAISAIAGGGGRAKSVNGAAGEADAQTSTSDQAGE
jgi:hypothetical protein